MWGIREGEKITSEHPAHFVTYAHRPEVSAFVHAQPTSINVITRLFRDEDSLNTLLSVQHEQLRIFSPKGIGLVDIVRHGSYELAEAVASSLIDKDICAVVRHGTFSIGDTNPIQALNMACDLQEYYHDAARTFLDNPWLRLFPVDLMFKNLRRISRLPLGDKMVNAFLRPPK
jgi:ribulose-5-phosphate 4-epimerase/fuculose-1-phosphate aldolase